MGKTTKDVFILLELKALLLELNKWTFLSVFYKNNSKTVFLFQNSRSLVLCGGYVHQSILRSNDQQEQSMHEWFQILSKNWYRTWSAHDITWVCCELNKLRDVHKCIMWYFIISIASSVFTFNWISLTCVLKNVIDTTKISSNILLLRSFLNISISTLWPKKHHP